MTKSHLFCKVLAASAKKQEVHSGGFKKNKYWIKSLNINHERIPEFEKKLQEKRKKIIPKGHPELFYSSDISLLLSYTMCGSGYSIPKEPARQLLTPIVKS